LSRAIASGRQNVDTQLDLDDKSIRCLSSKFSYSKLGGEKAREYYMRLTCLNSLYSMVTAYNFVCHCFKQKPPPSFLSLALQKSRESLASFFMWPWRNQQMAKDFRMKEQTFCILFNQLQVQCLVWLTVAPC